jgi:hypothetical protein
MSKIDTKIISGVKAFDVVSYFDRNIETMGAHFIDFDKVEIIVYYSEDLTQEEIDEKFEWAKETIFAAHLVRPEFERF